MKAVPERTKERRPALNTGYRLSAGFWTKYIGEMRKAAQVV